MGIFSDKGSLNFRQAKNKRLQNMGFENQSYSQQFACRFTVRWTRIESKTTSHVRNCEHESSNSGTLF